ncbi:hypothetical protein [Chitinimonas sp.]|uniref:hypothetical protein n=1 Tax=Chitinimonas sp. TaxID=1934313 RepID=UPI0035ADCC20
MPITTHLVCAPHDLDAPAVVTEWLVLAGARVQADVPLVRLAVAGEAHIVLTPMAGVLTEHCVAIGEPLLASDLLAMIEAEEPEFGITMLAPEEVQENLAVPACRQAHRPEPAAHVASDPSAIDLCAALGIAPDEVPATLAGQPSRQEVERHVRAELRLLAAMRQLMR